MSKIPKKIFFKNNKFFLRSAVEDDRKFIYNLITEFLTMNLSVTFLKMPSFDEFFKNKIERFIISDGTQSYGFVQILDNNEVGYFLDEQFRSKGLGTEAVELLMKFVPRKRYFATINDKNEPSKKLITKLGFKPKATIYEKIIDPD